MTIRQYGAAVGLATICLCSASIGCSPELVDREAEKAKEWRLELSLVQDHKTIPPNFAWLVLTNDSADDKLACTETEAWYIAIGSSSKGPGGRRDSCDGLERYQIVRAGSSITFPVRFRPEDLPDDTQFEFGFVFPELPWPPFLGGPEWRDTRWKGSIPTARVNGDKLLERVR